MTMLCPASAATATSRLGRAPTALPVALALVVVLGLGGYIAYTRYSENPAAKIAAAQPQPDQALAALSKWRSAGEVKLSFLEPRGIALGPGGALYVVGDAGVRVYNPDGTAKSEFAVGDKPHCVAVDGSGTVFVGFQSHVEVYSSAGHLQARWESPGKSAFITSIALAGPDIWVGDAGRKLVDHYSRAGQLLGSLGKRDDARKIPGLSTPSPHLDVAIGPRGEIVVTNPGRRAVETYDAAGGLKASWGRASNDLDGFCGCCNPTDLAILPDGKIVTSEKGLPRVKVYLPDGTLESLVAQPPDITPVAAGIDLAVGADGRVWVLDPAGRVVKVFVRK